MFRLQTFGPVALFDDDRRLEGSLAQHRRLALLAVLATAPGATMSRDKLLALLWPEADGERARQSLSQLLFLLRRDLGDVITGGAELALDPTLIATDAGEFSAAIHAGDVERAASLYQGPFLDGFHLAGSAEFSRWADAERDRFAREWRHAIEEVARTRTAAGDHRGAARALRQAADADPYDAHLALQLARAHAAAGDPPAALATLRVHATLVRQDLSVEPGADILAFMRELQSTPAVAPAPPALPVPSPDAVAPTDALRDAPYAVRQPAPATSDIPSGRRQAHGAKRRAAVVLALLAVAAIAFVSYVQLRRPAAAAAMPHRIVVAPLENRTGDTSLAALGEMVADWISQQLVRTGELDVVDARTAFATARVVDAMPGVVQQGGDRAIALARETRAAYVLGGRYYRDGDSLRAIVYLSDATTGAVRRSVGPVSVALRSPASLVSPLASLAVAAAVSQVDTGAASHIVGVNAPPSFEAYREASHAWESFYRGDREGVYAHVARAMQLDSTYMAPLAMEAFVRSEQMDWPRMAQLVARLDAHRARLTPAEGADLDVMHAQLRGDIDAELVAAQDVARTMPSAMELRTHVARLAVNANRPALALATLDDVDPARGVMRMSPWYWNWRCAALHALGRHDEELDVARRGLRQFPQHAVAALNVATALAALGRVDELRRLASQVAFESPAGRARITLDWARELRAHGHSEGAGAFAEAAVAALALVVRDTSVGLMNVRVAVLVEAGRLTDARRVADSMLVRGADDISAHGWLGAIAARQGDRAGAAREDSALANVRQPYSMGRHTMWRARIAALLGDRDRAVDLARRAWSEGHVRYFDPGNGRFDEPDLHTDPAFAGLRGYGPFEKLVAPRS